MKQPVWLMESESFFFLLLTFCLGESFILGMFESTYASCARLVIQLLYKIIPHWKTNSFLALQMMRRLPSKDSCSITGTFASTIFYRSNFAVQLPSSTTSNHGYHGFIKAHGFNARKWKMLLWKRRKPQVPMEILLSQGATEIFCWRYIDMQHAYTLYINIHFRHSYYSYSWSWCMYQQTTK